MKVVHLLSNWKWTERSEPAVDLALAESGLGADVTFVCGRSPRGAEHDVEHQAKRKGLESVVVLGMPKHVRLSSLRSDILEVRGVLADLQPDIVHCHMGNAHLLAALARGKQAGPLLVRSSYAPDGTEPGIRARSLYRRSTDGLVVMSEAGKRKAMAGRGLPEARVLVAEPGIDLKRFDPKRELNVRDARFGLDEGNFVVGLVSRVRETRRIDVVLGAIQRLAVKHKNVRLLIVGRGRRDAVRRVIDDPVAELGIRAQVMMAGYCRDDQLVAAYRAMDVLVYPMPGTDESCRTVREAMACGLPVIAPAAGFLPELVRDGTTGRIMEPTSQSVAGILSDWIEHPGQRDAIARRALSMAEARFDTRQQATKTLAFYEKLLDARLTASHG